MKRMLFAVFCLLFLSQGLAAQSPAPAAECPAPAPSFLTAGLPGAPAVEAVPDLPFLAPAPEVAACTITVCRQQCYCPGCFKHCVSTITCECECICP